MRKFRMFAAMAALLLLSELPRCSGPVTGADAGFPGRAYCAPGTAHAPAFGLRQQLAGQYFPPCAIYRPVHGGPRA
jgi:hypothetical protein